MALVGYFIVFSFVTKPGQTLEFLLWGTIVLLLQVPHNLWRTRPAGVHTTDRPSNNGIVRVRTGKNNPNFPIVRHSRGTANVNLLYDGHTGEHFFLLLRSENAIVVMILALIFRILFC